MIRICRCSANLRHLALKYGVLGRRSLGGLLMGLLLFSVTLLSAGSLFATGSHFDENPVATAKWEVREVKGEEESRYEITIYQVEAPGGTRWIWRAVDEQNGTYPGGFPIGSLRLQKRGKPRPELLDPLSPGVTQALIAIHSAVEAQEGEGWADGNAVGIRRNLPVVRTDVAAESGFFLKGSLKVEEMEIRGGKKPLVLTALEEELRYDDNGGLTQASWTARMTRGGEKSPGRELHLIRKEVAILEEEEGVEVQRGFEFLKPVVSVLRKGMSLKAVELAEEMFNKDRKEFEKGPLGDVVKDVDGLLDEIRELAKQPLNPDDRAKKLLGKPAPDFTLEDLDGDEVKLSDYQGKTVMLAFWGYS